MWQILFKGTRRSLSVIPSIDSCSGCKSHKYNGPQRFESGRKQVEMPTAPTLKTRLDVGAAAVLPPAPWPPRASVPPQHPRLPPPVGSFDGPLPEPRRAPTPASTISALSCRSRPTASRQPVTALRGQQPPCTKSSGRFGAAISENYPLSGGPHQGNPSRASQELGPATRAEVWHNRSL
jgi:hypothetical protein